MNAVVMLNRTALAALLVSVAVAAQVRGGVAESPKLID